MWVNPFTRRARLKVENLPTKDYGYIVNALLEGPYLPGTCSFRGEWTRSRDRHHFHHVESQFDARVVFNTAQAWWSAETDVARYVTDDSSTSQSLFAEVGRERNGVFFPDD